MRRDARSRIVCRDRPRSGRPPRAAARAWSAISRVTEADPRVPRPKAGRASARPGSVRRRRSGAQAARRRREGRRQGRRRPSTRSTRSPRTSTAVSLRDSPAPLEGKRRHRRRSREERGGAAFRCRARRRRARCRRPRSPAQDPARGDPCPPRAAPPTRRARGPHRRRPLARPAGAPPLQRGAPRLRQGARSRRSETAVNDLEKKLDAKPAPIDAASRARAGASARAHQRPGGPAPTRRHRHPARRALRAADPKSPFDLAPSRDERSGVVTAARLLLRATASRPKRRTR